jgi:hypothetical protein
MSKLFIYKGLEAGGLVLLTFKHGLYFNWYFRPIAYGLSLFNIEALS